MDTITEELLQQINDAVDGQWEVIVDDEIDVERRNRGEISLLEKIVGSFGVSLEEYAHVLLKNLP